MMNVLFITLRLCLQKSLIMGAEGHLEVDNDEKAVDIPISPQMEPPEYPTSNLHLLILGTAFFALWAGSVS